MCAREREIVCVCVRVAERMQYAKKSERGRGGEHSTFL